MSKINKTSKNGRMSKGLKNLLTVRELKTWLDGYCSAHSDDWSPTPEQWELIKTKIFSLEESVTENQDHKHVQYGKTNMPAPGTPVTFPQQLIRSRQDSFGQSTEGEPVGLTNRPSMLVGQNGSLKTPDKAEPGGPSDFA